MTLEIPNSIKNVRVPDLSEWSRNQKQLLIVGAVVFILLVIGLSVGLTKQTEGPTDWTAFDANDPFFEGRNRFGDKPTGMPSVMPSVVGSGDGMDGEEGGGGGGQPTSHNAGGDGSDFDIASFFMSPTPEPSQLSAMDAGAPSTMPSSSEEESILGVIGGYAFLDTNNDGLRDPNIESEPPLDDINVWLYSCTPPDLASIIDTTTTTTGANADVMLGMTQTNAQGLYNYVNLMEGYYRVQVQLGGQGYGVSQVWFDEGQDENGKVDNAIDPTTRSTACFELIGGATDISWNIGLIWQDADFDDDDETYSPTTEPTVLETKAPMWWDTPAPVGANGLRDTPAPIAAWFTQPDTPNNDNANTDNDNDTNNNNNNASPAPTPLSPYPLQGPFTLPSQRLILYGISEMNHMGNTQWRMLTAAYMEQFFDMELQGDGGGQDAIQNIVFDVVVSLDIDGEQLLPGRRDLREDGYQRELVEMDEVDDGLLDLPSISQPQRQLQGGIILTFTTTLSYRTFSSFIQTDTVAQRPFYDEIHRKAYVDFLMENNAVSHIGNILGVSEVFLGGEDVPVTPEMVELVEEEEEEGTPAPVTGGPSVSPETLTPSLSPLFQLPQPVLRTNAPTSAREVTSEPSPPPSKTKEVVTPEPTPSPIKEATSEPTTTSKPSLSPSTQKPSLPPTGLATSKPTTKPPTAETYYPTPTALLEAFYPTMTPNLSPDGEGRTGMMATAANVIEEEDEETRPRGTAANVVSEDDETPRPRATAANVIIATSLTKEERPRATAANVITTVPPRDERPKATTPPPSNPPTPPPTNAPTPNPTTSPTKHCPSNSPITTPLCPLLTEYECCAPMCTWDSGGGTNDKCVFINENDTDDIRREVEWLGEFEVGQTHVVKAENEARHAPRIVAQREVELLFTPAGAGNRRLGLGRSHTKSSFSSVSSRIESVGTVYLIKEHSAQPILDASAQRLIDGSQTVFSLPNGTPNIDIIVDLESLRLVEKVSFLLHGDASLKTAQLGLHYDDGRNQEEDDGFHLPSSSWTWFDMLSSESNIGERLMGRISISIPKDGARYVMIRLVGGSSGSLAHDHWGFGQIEIVGSMDGLSSTELSSQQGSNGANSILPMTRSIDPSYATTTTTTTSSRSFTPSTTTSVRIAVYSPTGHLIGATTARDPTKQRGILESRLSPLQIQDYSDMIWSATLPYNWIEEGNVVLIGCVDESRQREMLVRRLELVNLAQFSEHTISRTKMAIFGTESQVLSQLDSHTHDAKRLVRNLYSVMPVAELKWADTDLWHLPYIVIMGPDGPALVNSEEERREVTGDGEGTEISWRVMKNYLTIRHSLANTGHGLVVTSETGENSPYASGTSVFMGWSLSNRQQHDDEDDEWNWEDLGYWDTLAAAAWTGWVAMKAGDECSNYFVHEMGHAQTMQHFDEGAASNWGIADEYPQDGKHMDHHPWGYDTVSRQFRTWFDPVQGDGKLDPLNGAGEGPTSDQCFSQYTPYQAKKSQEWATATPILLSASSSGVATDGAYKFDTSTRQYSPLGGALLADAVGAAAMEPDQVGIPVITLIGTIGSDTSVCQTYPALRSRSGNTFQFPDPFNPDLPGAYYGAAHFFEVRFDGGRTVRGLIAVEGDLTEKSLKFFSFNVAIHRKPMSVGLYRFTDGSYPHLSPLSGTELLHLRPTGLHPDTPLMGLPPLLRVGRGWLGDSSDIVLDRFCVTAEDCDSGAYHVNWRSHVGSDSVIYASSLAPEPQQLLGSTIFKIPAKTEWGDTEYTITVLATRFFNDGLGSSPLLTTYPPSDDGSSDIDATHSIRVVAPWEMNALPAGTYHSVPGALTISAEAVGGGGSGNYHLLDLHISLNLGTITEPPTSSPTKRPTPGPSQSPVQVRYYIDWNDFTCVTDGESTEWAPPYASKEYCCRSHMAYDFAMCMRDEQ